MELSRMEVSSDVIEAITLHKHEIQVHINNGEFFEAKLILDNTMFIIKNKGKDEDYALLTDIVDKFLPTLSCGNEEYVRSCCSTLENLLNHIDLNVILTMMDVELKKGLTHESPSVRILSLKQLERCIESPDHLKNVVELGLLRHAFGMLGDVDEGVAEGVAGSPLSVYKYAMKCLLALASYDEGVAVLYGDEGLKWLHEVMAVSETVRYRAFDVIIHSINKRDEALNHATRTGLLNLMLQDLESDDILVRMVALESIVRLSDSAKAFVTLNNMGVFKGLARWISSDIPDAMYTVPSVVKVYANVCQKPGVSLTQFDETYPEYFKCVCRFISNCPDPSVQDICTDVFGILGSRLDGKEILLRNSAAVGEVIRVVTERLVCGTSEKKRNWINALSNVFGKPAVFLPDLANVSEEWFNSCHNGLIGYVVKMAHSGLDLIVPACNFLNTLIQYKFGVDALMNVAGWCEKLVDRRHLKSTEAEAARYTLITALCNALSDEVNSEVLIQLNTYVREGPKSRTLINPRIALED